MAAAKPSERKTKDDRQPKAEGENLLAVGRVAKAHGIKGEIKVYPYSGDPAAFPDYPAVTLIAPDGQELGTYPVTDGRLQGRHAILRLAGIERREQAEALAGCEIRVDKAQLPPLAENEFYWQEMEGRRVVTTDGRDLGRVSGLLATGAHDILRVTGRGREYLIPATREVMAEIDDKAGVIVIDPPPGLLEMNER